MAPNEGKSGSKRTVTMTGRTKFCKAGQYPIWQLEELNGRSITIPLRLAPSSYARRVAMLHESLFPFCYLN
jgi:hypothetical protein